MLGLPTPVSDALEGPSVPLGQGLDPVPTACPVSVGTLQWEELRLCLRLILPGAASPL